MSDHWWEKYKVDLPARVSGNCEILKFQITDNDASFYNLRQCINPHRGYRPVHPGTYTALHRSGTIWMSDTLAEIKDHLDVIRRATGNCLVNGLGLGLVARGMLLKKEVSHVTVIEIDPNVIALVAPHYQEQFGRRLTVIQADALEWKPTRGMKYDVVWHDIWESICGDNLESMQTLHRRYGSRSKWQGSWCHTESRRQAKAFST